MATSKKLKLNESTLSTILGAVVVLVVGLLIFNYFKQAGKEQVITPEAAQEEKEITFEEEDGQLTPVNLPVKHKVGKSEFLWKIAEKYYGSGYNWVDIALENNLANPNFIFVYQELNIPKVAVRKPVETISQTETATPEKITEDKYEVKKGDNLWSIALRAYADGYKWTEIAKLNNLIDPNHIEVGQKLKLAR